MTNMVPAYRVPVYASLSTMVQSLDVVALDGCSARGHRGCCSVYVRRLDTTLYIRGGPSGAAIADTDALVVTGFDQLAYWRAAFAAKRYSVPVIVLFGSSAASSSGGLVAAVARRPKRQFLSRADRVVTYGSESSELAERLGVGRDRIIESRNSSWVPVRTAPHSSPGVPLRLLFVGRLVRRKNPGIALEAAHLLSERLSVAVEFVGEGPEMEALLCRAASAHCEVQFSGHLSGDALVSAYDRNDILVFPTDREPWGLVVNEALARGLPVVTTCGCGAARDLIEGRDCGCIVVADAAQIADACWRLSRSERYQRASLSALSSVAAATPVRMASDLAFAIGAVCRGR